GRPTLLVGTDIPALLASDFPIKSTAPARPFDPQTDVLISAPLSGRTGWRAGDDIALDSPTGRTSVHVHAIFYDFGNERGQLLMTRSTYAAAWNDQRITSLHVRLKPGSDPETTAPR